MRPFAELAGSTRVKPSAVTVLLHFSRAGRLRPGGPTAGAFHPRPRKAGLPSVWPVERSRARAGVIHPARSLTASEGPKSAVPQGDKSYRAATDKHGQVDPSDTCEHCGCCSSSRSARALSLPAFVLDALTLGTQVLPLASHLVQPVGHGRYWPSAILDRAAAMASSRPAAACG